MNCPKCGAVNAQNASICSACGNKLQTQNDSLEIIEDVEVIPNEVEEILEIEDVPTIEPPKTNQQPVTNNIPVKPAATTPQVVAPVANMPAQPVTPTSQTVAPVASKQVANSHGNKSKLPLMIGGALIALVIIGLTIFFIVQMVGKNNDNKPNTNPNHSAFFIKNNESKYALFSKDGKKLTDFVYESANGFINKSAVVINQDKQYAIISDDNKVIVDYGKYSKIERVGDIYSAIDNENKQYLLNANGEVVKELTNIDLRIYGDTKYMSYVTGSDLVLLDNHGNEALKLSKIQGKDFDLSGQDNYLIVFYNNKSYLIDIALNKQVISFDSNDSYCISSRTGNKLVLVPCNNEESKEGYVVVDNDKMLLRKYDEACLSPFLAGGNLMCQTADYKVNILDNKGNVIKDMTNSLFVNASNYGEQITDKIDMSTVFNIYKDGKLQKEIACKKISQPNNYLLKPYYLLAPNTAGKCSTNDKVYYEFYKEDGTVLTTDKYLSAEAYDDNSLAVVSKEEGKYYLINNEVKQVSKEYAAINLIGSIYRAETFDGKLALLDSAGQELLVANELTVLSSGYISAKNNEEYLLYIVKDNKVINRLTGLPTIDNQNYFTIKNNDKTEYYLYSGAKFYEQ